MPRSNAQTRITRLALGSLAVGIAVLGLKFWSWWITGSVAVLSDALESVVNVAAAAMAFWAVRVASRPADANHPHGHEKAEFLSAITEGALVLLTSLLILREAIEGLLSGASPVADPLGAGVLALATLLNLVWARVLLRRGDALRSPALQADGRHLMVDVWTSVAVLAALALVPLTGLSWIDPALALVVGVHVLWSGWRMIRRSLGGLMDETVEPETLAELSALVEAHLGDAIEAHDLKVRPLGRGLAVEMHLVVPGGMTVDRAHALCDDIEEALVPAVHGGTILIHLEPHHHAKNPDTMIFEAP